MVREKRILSYILSWLLLGYIILFIGINNVNAEVIEPTTGYRSQIGTLLTDETIYWNTSDIGGYGNMLSFGTGPTYSTWGIPAYIRLIAITNVSSNYSYKLSYNMTIFTPNSTSNTWDSTKLDTNYNLMVGDDLGVIKESKCSVVNTESFSGDNGTFTTKSISCVMNLNKNQDNVWLSAGYYCKNCSLSSLEALGYVPQDSYMYITEPVLEQFNDNSNIIVDQNQTIIDQNSQIIQGQDNIINNNKENTDSIIDNNNQNTQDIIDSNKETQDVIKDQFNDCRDSYNLFNVTDYKNLNISNNNANLIIKNEIQVDVSTNGTGNYSGFWIPYSYIPGYIDGYNSNKTYYISFDVHASDTMKLRYGSDKYTSVTMGNTKTRVSIQTSITQAIIFYAMPGLDNASFYISNIMISETNSTKYESYGEEICSNKLDETNDKLGDLNDALTDSSSPDTGTLENSAGWLPPGPLDSILNLPLTMLNSLTNSLGKSCSPLILTLPYVNKNIQIPCLSSIFAQITGVNGLWTWVGTIASVLILYNYLLNLYAWVDRVLTLRAEFDEAMGADLANWGRL